MSKLFQNYLQTYKLKTLIFLIEFLYFGYFCCILKYLKMLYLSAAYLSHIHSKSPPSMSLPQYLWFPLTSCRLSIPTKSSLCCQEVHGMRSSHVAWETFCWPPSQNKLNAPSSAAASFHFLLSCGTGILVALPPILEFSTLDFEVTYMDNYKYVRSHV